LNVTMKKLRNKIMQGTYRPGKSKLAAMKGMDAAIESGLNSIMGKKKKKSAKCNGKDKDEKKE